MTPQQILDDIAAALKGELGSGFSQISTFVQTQGRLLARQAEGIARERADGELAGDDEFFEFLLGNLQRNTRNMAQSVAMLTILTIEKAWNAIANALWGGIRQILSNAGVPAGLLPETPPLSV
jgi:hypothetical protein